MMYYNAGETSTPINCWVENIIAVVPNFGKKVRLSHLDMDTEELVF